MRRLPQFAAAFLFAHTAWAGDTMEARIQHHMDGSHRSEANIARNAYRHPAETMAFFGLADGMTVVEIWPGNGWYTEILAPAIKGHGTYVAAAYDPDVPDQPEYRYRLTAELQDKFAAHPELYDEAVLHPFSVVEAGALGEAGSADLVVTFRNLHGWINDGIAADMFAEFFRVLKPGGTLGLVQHRAAEGADPAETVPMGYVPEATAIALAEAAGFTLEARSEINANPADTRDHPEGVWTLPPSLRLGDTDRDTYLAIGESDRMTLRFRKPGDA